MNFTEALALLLVFGVLPLVAVTYLVVAVLRPWCFSLRHGLGVAPWTLFGMSYLGINALRVLRALHAARQAGLVDETVHSFTSADIIGTDLDAVRQDLLEAAEQGITPKLHELIFRHTPSSVLDADLAPPDDTADDPSPPEPGAFTPDDTAPTPRTNSPRDS